MGSRSVAYLVVRADAAAGLLVEEGDEVEDGQPLGKACARDGLVLAPVSGTVRFIQFDAERHTLLIYIRPQGTGHSRAAELCRSA